MGTSITGGTRLAQIDWIAAVQALIAGGLPCSGGDRRMLLLSASLAAGIPADLSDAVIGLDAWQHPALPHCHPPRIRAPRGSWSR